MDIDRVGTANKRIDARPQQRETEAGSAEHDPPIVRALAGDQRDGQTTRAKHDDDDKKPCCGDDGDEWEEQQTNPGPVRAFGLERLVRRQHRGQRHEVTAQVGVKFGEVGIEGRREKPEHGRRITVDPAERIVPGGVVPAIADVDGEAAVKHVEQAGHGMNAVPEKEEHRRSGEIGQQHQQSHHRDPRFFAADSVGRARADEAGQRIEQVITHVVAGADIESKEPREQRRAVVLERVVAAMVVGRAPRVGRRQLVAEAEIEHARHVGDAFGIAGDRRVQAFDEKRPGEHCDKEDRGQTQTLPRIAGTDDRPTQADERERQQPDQVRHGDEVLEEIEPDHDDQRRQDEREPRRLPWEETPEDDRAADDIKADQ